MYLLYSNCIQFSGSNRMNNKYIAFVIPMFIIFTCYVISNSEQPRLRDTELNSHFTFMEGQVAKFKFTFNKTLSNSDIILKFKVGLTKQLPFYEVGPRTEESFLTEDEKKRIHIQFNSSSKNFTSGISNPNVYEVQITITNVSRKDAGTYVCVGYLGSHKLKGFTRRSGIDVNFSPRKPVCVYESDNSKSGDDMVILQCSASLGSQQGGFQCFQNGELVPQHTKVITNVTTMYQSLWVSKKYHAFCCSVNYGEHKDCSECNDYVSNYHGDRNDKINQNSCQSNESTTQITPITHPVQHTYPSTTQIYDMQTTTVSSITAETKAVSKHSGSPINMTKVMIVVLPTSVAILLAALFIAIIKRFQNNEEAPAQEEETDALKPEEEKEEEKEEEDKL